MELPGAITPPDASDAAPSVPLPARRAPPFTVTAELAMPPLTISTPLATVVVPL
ncbi:hypothetical protein D9M68_906860 [compost metagenome]